MLFYNDMSISFEKICSYLEVKEWVSFAKYYGVHTFQAMGLTPSFATLGSTL